MSEGDELIDRWFEELINEDDRSVADEILAEDVTYHGPQSLSPREVSSREDLRKFLAHYHRAFPDVTYSVERVFGDDDEYCVRWRAEGTHEEELFGIAGSGESFTGYGLSTFTVDDGRITEVWSTWDSLGMVQELDLVSQLGVAAAGKR